MFLFKGQCSALRTAFRHLVALTSFTIYASRRPVSQGSSPVRTIFALASGHGKSGIAVIRVSGPNTNEVLSAILSPNKAQLSPRKATLRYLYDPADRSIIDKGLVLWFPQPGSFTGEDSCEFHVHGGLAVTAAIMEALATIPHVYPAEPGEFTKRAFFNGKLDLTEVDGLADLIAAETELQRKQAIRQLDGELGRLYTSWKEILLTATASTEAYIDFAEEENIEADTLRRVSASVESLIGSIQCHLDDNRRGERLRNGVHCTIMGEPNVGKSSLLNLLCQRPKAIVSSIPGTTRDVLETALNIGGYPVVLNDTAGLRQTEDVVEREGIRRAIERCQNSDLNVLVLDASSIYTSNDDSSPFILNQTDWLQSHDVDQLKRNSILVLNKIDLVAKSQVNELLTRFQSFSQVCPLSCTSKEGVDHFMKTLTSQLKIMCGNPSAGSPSLTQARYRQHLSQCLALLHQFKKLRDSDLVFAAERLRQALRHLGKITGRITTEDILDVVFRDFCIGK